jgi:Cu+-exporting ATPase
MNNEMISLDARDKEIEVELLQVNDLIKVYPGSVVPLDAMIVFGRGICNEAMLTGESRPVQKDIGSRIYGGSTLV